MPGNGVEKTKRSRITAACAVCRQKRQKCSGEKYAFLKASIHSWLTRILVDHSVTSANYTRKNVGGVIRRSGKSSSSDPQAIHLTSLRSGPAKDYLRSLQDRLQETETLLLGALNRLPDDEVQVALQQGKSASHQTWTTSMSGQDYWARYPLNRLDTVREWQRSHMSATNSIQTPRQLYQGKASAWSDADNTRDIKVPSVNAVSMSPALQSGIAREHSTISKNEDHGRYQMTGDSIAPHEERYSEETRDVAQTLFSISNQRNTLPRGDQPRSVPQETLENDVVSADLESLPSRFPKHLFW